MGSLKDFTLKTFDFLDRSSIEFEKEKFENNEDDQRSKKVIFSSVRTAMPFRETTDTSQIDTEVISAKWT